MPTKDSDYKNSIGSETPHQDRAADLLEQYKPVYLGVDEEGAHHYWDTVRHDVAVIEDDADGVVDLDDTPFTTLREWSQYVESERGWQSEPRIGGSLVEDIREELRGQA